MNPDGIARRPPKRRCPGCGGDVYAWQEDALCRSCLAEERPHRAELADVVRENRTGRLEGRELPERPPLVVPYNEFPEGF